MYTSLSFAQSFRAFSTTYTFSKKKIVLKAESTAYYEFEVLKAKSTGVVTPNIILIRYTYRKELIPRSYSITFVIRIRYN